MLEASKSKSKIIAETLEIVYRIIEKDLEKLNLNEFTLFMYLYFTDFIKKSENKYSALELARKNINSIMFGNYD